MIYRRHLFGPVMAVLILGVLMAIGSAGVRAAESAEFTMRVMDVFTITGRGTVLTGKVLSGSLVAGDVVCVPLRDGEFAARRVDSIQMTRKVIERAEEGQLIAVLLQVDKDQVEKNAVMHGDCKLDE